jgi:hypothetical protein
MIQYAINLTSCIISSNDETLIKLKPEMPERRPINIVIILNKLLLFRIFSIEVSIANLLYFVVSAGTTHTGRFSLS